MNTYRLNKARFNKIRENPTRQVYSLRQACQDYTILGYEYEHLNQWYDVAILYQDKLVLIDLIPRYAGRGIPRQDKKTVIRKIQRCTEDKTQLILVEPDSISNMKGQIARALLTGESGRIRQTKREKQIRQKKSKDVR